MSSSELNDQEPLTLAHLLLIWSPNVPLPHKVEEQTPKDPTFGNSTDVNQRAQLQALLLSQFHTQWRHEYLQGISSSIQKEQTQIITGDIILVHDTSGRLGELMEGKDGLVHAVNSSNLPIARLIPLQV